MAEIKPLGCMVFVKMIKPETKSESGIITTTGKWEKMEDDSCELGEVVNIGATAYHGITGCNPEKYPTGSDRYKMQPHEIWGISVGDVVEMRRAHEGKKATLNEGHRYIQDTNIVGKLVDGKVIPLGNYIAVEIKTKPIETESGIIIETPENASLTKEAADIGVVKEFGSIAYHNVMGCNPEKYPTSMQQSKMQPHEIWGVNAGDTVEFNKFDGKKSVVKTQEKVRYIPDTDIIGKVIGEVEL